MYTVFSHSSRGLLSKYIMGSGDYCLRHVFLVASASDQPKASFRMIESNVGTYFFIWCIWQLKLHILYTIAFTILCAIANILSFLLQVSLTLFHSFTRCTWQFCLFTVNSETKRTVAASTEWAGTSTAGGYLTASYPRYFRLLPFTLWTFFDFLLRTAVCYSLDTYACHQLQVHLIDT